MAQKKVVDCCDVKLHIVFDATEDAPVDLDAVDELVSNGVAENNGVSNVSEVIVSNLKFETIEVEDEDEEEEEEEEETE